ncbi:hypothetical protein Sta7437_4802 (plasmid) [Stanieria cyanosphaera PCC 7437]|uniref:Uncharacterized protein n=1 Tax=Stanieria cyanosphaera (strain ATCC 29371 / PCC 7437) TaxID=111780 RepID=K9Y082_STAC7|nr:hypothetical protein [Stanieria cyanosphaera]AFZ38240.1 hypothetical protein Sta7437_4802 [Stanieria cyanosphaera PCC 7437]
MLGKEIVRENELCLTTLGLSDILAECERVDLGRAIPTHSSLSALTATGISSDGFDWLLPITLQEELLSFAEKLSSQNGQLTLSSLVRQTCPQLLGGERGEKSESKKGESTQTKKFSIPCIIKQFKQPELKGFIQKDLGDRFIVYIPEDDSTITVSKLLVYPDFPESKSSGQINKIPSTKKVTPPSKNSLTLTRRNKGDGTGYIYHRTITRRGKQYEEFYYRYRDEAGKLRSKYIPTRLLDKVRSAELSKKPITDILFLLGGGDISRGEQSDTLDDGNVQIGDENNESDSINRGEQLTPPSNKKRKQGCGTGYIECKPIKRSGKEYKQYWYHYEEWREGECIDKKSKYIPKRLVQKLEKMDNEKQPVRIILELLEVKK